MEDRVMNEWCMIDLGMESFDGIDTIFIETDFDLLSKYLKNFSYSFENYIKMRDMSKTN